MRSAAYGVVAPSDMISVIAEATPEALDRIEDFATVQAYAGGVAILRIAVSDLPALRDTEGVSYIKAGSKVRRHMKQARETGNVEKAHKGTDLPQGYDGTGVTVGVVDDGIDFTHKAFTDAKGDLRIRSVSRPGDDVMFDHFTDPASILAMGTDTKSATHGTHTTSMGAGRELGNGMGGVAPNSDIVLVAFGSAADGSDDDGDEDGDDDGGDDDYNDPASAALLACAQEAVRLINESGQPGVINMSLGINAGPRDGSAAEAKFMRGLAKDNIIVMSAGNEAANNIAALYTFKEDGESAYISLCDSEFSPTPDGEIYFWSDDSTSLELEMSLYSSKDMKSLGVVCDVKESTDCQPVEVSGDGSDGAKLFASIAGKDAHVAYMSGLNPDNNRYVAGFAIDGATWMDFKPLKPKPLL